MVFIDVHCHLEFYNSKELEEIIERARKANVKIIINNGLNIESNLKIMNSLSPNYKEIKAALGLYPIDALKMREEEISYSFEFIKSNKNSIIALGEVGLDFKEDEKCHEKQKRIFQNFIELSFEIDKPLIVHSRKAEKEVIEILEKNNSKKVIMHCFSGNMKLVDRIISNGWFISIPSSIKNSEHFQNVVKRVPIGNLFCETDSPYLHPEKIPKNEPANVIVSYSTISKIKNRSLEEVENQIEKNFEFLFSNKKQQKRI